MIDKSLEVRIEADMRIEAEAAALKRVRDDYFMALHAALRDMPLARQDERAREIRAHLHAMVEARRADGLDEAAAWRAAMSEFGEPREVGRALWKQWVNSGQMEEQGAPLTRKQRALKWLFPLVWTVAIGALLGFNRTSIFEACAWMLVILPFAELGRSYSPSVAGKWSAAGTFLWLVSAFSILNVVFAKEWQGTMWGDIRNYLTLVAALFYLPVYLSYRKREIERKPWTSDRKFLRSPIAAEQKYRMEPRIVLTTAALFSCAFIVSQGSRFLHWPAVITMCATIVAAAFTAHRWLTK